MALKEEPSIGLRDDRRILTIILTMAVIFFVGGSVLVYINQTYTVLRPSIVLAKDLFIGFFTVSSLLVAAETLRRSALSSRKLLALRLFDQWEAQHLDSDVQAVIREIAEAGQGKLCEIVEGDKRIRKKIIDFLNSCERIAIAVVDGSADERTLRERMMPTLAVYFRELSPLILNLRRNYAESHLFIYTERLLARWDRSR